MADPELVRITVELAAANLPVLEQGVDLDPERSQARIQLVKQDDGSYILTALAHRERMPREAVNRHSDDD